MHYCILCSYRSSLFSENRRRFLSQLASTGSLIFEKISRGLFGIVVLPFGNLTPGLLLWLVLAPSSQAPPLVAVAVSTVMAADSSHAASHSPQRFGPWYLLTSYAVSVRHPSRLLGLLPDKLLRAPLSSALGYPCWDKFRSVLP